MPDDALEAFPFKKLLHYSAKENRGRAALDEALGDAVQWLKGSRAWRVIGAGRAAVKARLEEMYAQGRQPFRRMSSALFAMRLVTSFRRRFYSTICQISARCYSRGALWQRNHSDAGAGLDAVYAVFDRQFKAFKNIERYGGRSPLRSRGVGVAEAQRGGAECF